MSATIHFREGDVHAATLDAVPRIVAEYDRAKAEGRTVTAKDGTLQISGLPRD